MRPPLPLQPSARPGPMLAVAGLAVAIILVGCAPTHAEVAATPYQGWTDALHLGNGEVEAVVVPSVARVIHLSRPGQPNLFRVDPKWAGKPQDPDMETTGTYRDFGGAKLWVAPQAQWGTRWGNWPPHYALDSAPTVSELRDDGAVRLIGQASTATGVRFQRTVSLLGAAVHNQVSMVNVSTHAVTFAPWSVLCVRPGGTVFMPAPADAKVWMADNHPTPESCGWRRVAGMLVLEHASGRDGTKLFVTSSQGWIGYLIDGEALFLAYHADAAATYPDGEASSELYVGKDFIEIEHIARFERLAPGASATLDERWHVRQGPAVHGDLAAQAAWMAATAAELPDR